MFSSAVLICDVKRLPSKTLYKNPIKGFHDSVFWGLQSRRIPIEQQVQWQITSVLKDAGIFLP